EDLAARVSGWPRPDAQAELCHELSRLAVLMTSAYRACVSLLAPDRQSLVVVGLAPDAGAWPAEFSAQSRSLKEDSAAAHARPPGRSSFIEATFQSTIHYKPTPPEARSHAAVLLRNGTHLIGVLGVDWERSGAFDAPMQEALEQLASRYAVA